MLSKWKIKKENYKNSGYDVLAISPTFPKDQLGVGEIPDWGKGTGQLEVDYFDTSKDFWAIVSEHRPIAIMSFSRGENDKSWELEAAAQNLKQAAWGNDFQGHKPHAGGSNADFSPFKGKGVIADNPPDPTVAAGQKRESNLPLPAIEKAIDDKFPDAQINPFIDDTEPPDVGQYVSEYMAYHVAWYREWWETENEDPNKAILKSGHTHVGVQVSVANAETAVELQLDELLKVLPNP